MEALKGWALAVCAAAVAGSLARMAAPSGATEKLMSLTVSLFFLCALLSPALVGIIGEDFSPFPEAGAQTELNTGALEEEMQRQVERSFISTMQKAVRAALGELEVTPREILINVNTGGQDGISIREVRVTLDQVYSVKQEEIVIALTEAMGQKPVLLFVGVEREGDAPAEVQAGGTE